MVWGKQQHWFPVGGSNQQFQCSRGSNVVTIPVPILSTASVWNSWSTTEKLRWIAKHCRSTWWHHSSGWVCFQNSNFNDLCVYLSLWAAGSSSKITLKNWVITNNAGDESHLFRTGSRWVGTFTQTLYPNPSPPSPCKLGQEMKGLAFSSMFGLRIALQFSNYLRRGTKAIDIK